MTKGQYEIHLNYFHAASEISEFAYLLNRKKRKKGYVKESTLQWYYDNMRVKKGR